MKSTEIRKLHQHHLCLLLPRPVLLPPPSSTPVCAQKIANMRCGSSKVILNQLISQLEESNKNMNKLCSLVKKHEELLSKPTMRERNKHVPITVRVISYSY